MIELIRAMFATPEAQSDPYVWAAALLGHWAVGAGLAALLLCLTPRAALIVSLAYGLLWEGGQVLLASGGLWDGVLDWSAVTLGAVTAAALWRHKRAQMASAVGAILVVLTAGTRRRK